MMIRKSLFVQVIFAHILSKDKGSPEFLSDSILLKALGESRLDKGTGKGGPKIIRITVLRAFHGPLVFKWFPSTEGQNPSLHVKRVRMRTDENGQRTYLGLDIDRRIKLRPSQDKNLKTLFGNSNFDKLPHDCWQEPGNDGSIWIYETAEEGGATVITRYNPINPDVVNFPITKERLLKELNLTTFALMIWTLSGIDDAKLY